MEKPKVLHPQVIENQIKQAKANQAYLKTRIKELENENPNTYATDSDYLYCQQRLNDMSNKVISLKKDLAKVKNKELQPAN